MSFFGRGIAVSSASAAAGVGRQRASDGDGRHRNRVKYDHAYSRRVGCVQRSGARLIPPRGGAKASTRVTARAATARATTGKHARRRQRKAVVVRRGQFKNRDERPPWRVELVAEVHEMGFEEHDQLNPVGKYSQYECT